MFARRFVAVVLFAASVAAALLTSAPASADISAQDQQFLDVVKQLNVPVNSDADAITIGRDICTAVDAGKIQPASTVRGVMSRLQAQGLDKGQAANLVWGAVAAYCPQYRAIVGR
ncbi:DUF732 domain-containing protein [Mycolicibacterium arenosum]|uniref:DUF732 domain-containing protein n=1 Tax=Mycolicibacterium arenosum TaxID=2952157 RepID=A0ABT1LV10_9MYCO|nr:DUF732 domain-containing protein [Mycolicibacterium sp. CAU 1645]MCP9270739.1 DUF732 domain-containing protein [Mycolicibacterium sp. CAU 1645]